MQKHMIAASLLALTTALLGGYYAGQYACASVPPPAQVAILDLDALMAPFNGPTLDRTGMEQAAEAARSRVLQQTEQGTVVLDPSAIVAAPKSAYVE